MCRSQSSSISSPPEDRLPKPAVAVKSRRCAREITRGNKCCRMGHHGPDIAPMPSACRRDRSDDGSGHIRCQSGLPLPRQRRTVQTRPTRLPEASTRFATGALRQGPEQCFVEISRAILRTDKRAPVARAEAPTPSIAKQKGRLKRPIPVVELLDRAQCAQSISRSVDQSRPLSRRSWASAIAVRRSDSPASAKACSCMARIQPISEGEA